MNRADELREIYKKSGLSDLLINPEIKYFEKEKYTKLKFEKNDFKISSIELHELDSGSPYFKIHHRDSAPNWISEAMQKWEGLRETSPTFGSSFDGDPLAVATKLADLLRSKA